MKKTLLFIAVLASIIGISLAIADYQVLVTAVVGNINHSPVIINVNPGDDPRLLRTNRIQHYSVYFRDNEKDISTFTVTSPDGYLYPLSGTVSKYDSQSGAYIDFTYSSPSSAPSGNISHITLTINDGSGTNIISKDLDVYVY